MSALDSEFRQVLLYFEDDENALYYHHRLLFVQGPDGKWIGVSVSPTLEVQVADLAKLAGQVTPLKRCAPFHSNIPREEIFAFDPISRDTEERLREECLDFAALLGFVQKAPPPRRSGRWLVADTASELFAQKVPEEALADPDITVIRGDSGLAMVDRSWLLMQRVFDADLDTWKMNKWTGQGRDPRIAGSKVDAYGRRFVSEADALALWRPPKSQPRDNPLQGPCVAQEYFEGLRTAGNSLVAHDFAWRHRSGVPETGIVARFHGALAEIVRYLVCVDQLDATNCIGIELAVRYLVMIEAACDRNPKQPEWEGLDALVCTSVSARGSLELPKFNGWVSSFQRDRAVVLKQGRLLREERAADAKRKGGPASKESQA